jgi:hypothetical protein
LKTWKNYGRDLMVSDAIQIQYQIDFTERFFDIQSWLRKAQELLDSAGILKHEVDAYWSGIEVLDGSLVQRSGNSNPQASYFMLVAYAIENYLKAILIHHEQEKFKNKLISRLPRFLRDHDLVKLAAKSNLILCTIEEDLLTRLSKNAIWAAHYPTPTLSFHLNHMAEHSDGQTYLTAYFAPNDTANVEIFLRRLRAHVSGETNIAVSEF